MSGHRKWDDTRTERGTREPEPPSPHRPPCCCYCGRTVRRWQSYGGWGPMGFSPATANTVWHSRCLNKRWR